MSCGNRPISKSLNIARFFQNKTQVSIPHNKTNPLKNTYIKFVKPEVLRTIHGHQFPQMIFKKIKMNFRITQRKESFNDFCQVQAKKYNQTPTTKNPQKLIFEDQDQQQQVIDQLDSLNLNEQIFEDRNLITIMNIKSLPLNELIQRNPIFIFRNQILRQKFRENLKTQECPKSRQFYLLQAKQFVSSQLIKRRPSLKKDLFEQSQLKRLLNLKQQKQKNKPMFKITTPKQKKEAQMTPKRKNDGLMTPKQKTETQMTPKQKSKSHTKKLNRVSIPRLG